MNNAIRFVLKRRNDSNQGSLICGDFVAIDHHSGGYPYYTDIWAAHKFICISDARDYARSFPKENWEVFKTNVVLEKWPLHSSDKCT